jgi:type I restriction enzyme M protein
MINEHVFILRCQNLETQKYLFHYLFSEVGQALLRNNITGAAQGGLNSTNLRNIKIPLPPLAEQKKIVVEMEKLEKEENETKEKIENGKYEIKDIVETTSKYPSVLINDVAIIQKGTSITKEKTKTGNIPVIAGGQEPAYFHNVANRNGNVITVSASGAYAGFVNYFEIPIFASDCNTIQSKDENNISTKLIYYFLKSIQQEIYGLQRGQAQPHVYTEDLANIKLPLPPLAEQKKIVKEIENIETEISEAQKIIDDMSVRKKKVLEKYGISS